MKLFIALVALLLCVAPAFAVITATDNYNFTRRNTVFNITDVGFVKATNITGSTYLCIGSDCRSAWPSGAAYDDTGLRTNISNLQTSNTSTNLRITTINTTVANLLTTNTTVYGLILQLGQNDTNLNSSINAVNTRATTLNTSITNLLTTNTTLFGLILQLGQNDTNLNASINAVNTRATTLNTTISGLYTNVTVLQGANNNTTNYRIDGALQKARIAQGAWNATSDVTGNGYTLTQYGGVYYDAVNEWLVFGGETDMARTFNLSTPITGFTTGSTVSMWLYPNISTHRSRPLSSNGFATFYYDSGLSSYVWFCGNGATYSGGATASGAVSYNAWQHMAITNDGSTCTLWKNGASISTQASPGVGGIGAASPAFNIGTGGSGDVHNGSIDDVRVYNRSLTLTELQQLVANGSVLTDLKAWYPFTTTVDFGQYQNITALQAAGGSGLSGLTVNNLVAGSSSTNVSSINVTYNDAALRVWGQNFTGSSATTLLQLINIGDANDGSGARGRANIELWGDQDQNGTISFSNPNDRRMAWSCHGNLTQVGECTLYANTQNGSFNGKILDFSIGPDFDRTLQLIDAQGIEVFADDNSVEGKGFFANETAIPAFFRTRGPRIWITTDTNANSTGDEIVLGTHASSVMANFTPGIIALAPTNGRVGVNTTAPDATFSVVGNVGINASTNGAGLNISNTFAGRATAFRVNRPGTGGLFITTAGGTPGGVQVGVESGSGVTAAPINIFTTTSGDYLLGDITIGNSGGGTTQPTLFVKGTTAQTVGINTSSPNATLEVVGVIKTDNLTVDQNLTVSGALSVPVICLNGNCSSVWPAGGSGVSGGGNMSVWTITNETGNSNLFNVTNASIVRLTGGEGIIAVRTADDINFSVDSTVLRTNSSINFNQLTNFSTGQINLTLINTTDTPNADECLKAVGSGDQGYWDTCGTGGGGGNMSFFTITNSSGTSNNVNVTNGSIVRLYTGDGVYINRTTDDFTFNVDGTVLRTNSSIAFSQIVNYSTSLINTTLVNATNSPGAGDCLTAAGSADQFTWDTCGTGGSGIINDNGTHISLGSTSFNASFTITAANNINNFDNQSQYHQVLRATSDTNGRNIGLGFVDSSNALGGAVGAAIVYTRAGSNGFGNLSFYTKPSGSNNTKRLTISDNGSVNIFGLTNCDTIDTDANGLLTCGTDATGGGGFTYSDYFDQTLNRTSVINASRFSASLGSIAVPAITTNLNNDSGIFFLSDGTTGFSNDGAKTFQCNADGCQVPSGGTVFTGIQSTGDDDTGISWLAGNVLGIIAGGNVGGGVVANFSNQGVGVTALCMYPDSNPLMPCRGFHSDPEAQRRYMVTDIDTFVVGGAETGEYGTWGWTTNTLPTGGDVTSTATAFDVKTMGVLSLGSGTVIGTNVSISTDTSTSAGFWINGSSGINAFYTRVAADLTGHTANNYTTMVGFTDVQDKRIGVDAVIAMYNSSQSTNWILATCNTNVCSTNVSNIRWGNNSFADIEVQVWNNTQALMFINGTLAATLHSNLPSGSGDLLWAGSIRHGNTNGTTESRLYIDYYGVAKVFNEARY